MLPRITSYNVCYTKLLRDEGEHAAAAAEILDHDILGVGIAVFIDGESEFAVGNAGFHDVDPVFPAAQIGKHRDARRIREP